MPRDWRCALVSALVWSGVAVHAAAAAERPGAPVFPLRIEPGQRHLVDAAGRPFLIHGEAAWSLIAQLDRDKAERYLADRSARGFNALLVNLIEHRFATHAPANAYGAAPFTIAGDYGTPNEAYFAHVDWLLRRAAELGFLVILSPSYMGAGGGDEGWYRTMAANGAAALRRYGEFLGRRYRDLGNILWLHGGDYDPPDPALAAAIAAGIRTADPVALHAAHGAPETAVLDVWRERSWLQLNTVYTYKPVFEAARREYRRATPMPFILLESAYENEHGATAHRLRVQAWQAMLAGAAGHVFGNNPIWHFDGPGLHAAPMGWEQALGAAGRVGMMQLRRLLDGLPWWRLRPDLDAGLLTSGVGSRDNQAVAAATADGMIALVYLPSARRVTVNLARLAGPLVRARWYDPTSGALSNAGDALRIDGGPRSFRPDLLRNQGGAGDWVLILESHV